MEKKAKAKIIEIIKQSNKMKIYFSSNKEVAYELIREIKQNYISDVIFEEKYHGKLTMTVIAKDSEMKKIILILDRSDVYNIQSSPHNYVFGNFIIN